MTKPTPSQEKILKVAAKNPDCDVRDFMTHITIRSVSEKVIQTMLANEWIAEDDASAYRITAAGYEAVGAESMITAKQTPSAAANKDKPQRTTKQDTMLMMLKEGTTLKALMEATGWQKHSVHGAMANLKKKQNLNVTTTKDGSEDRVYKIA